MSTWTILAAIIICTCVVRGDYGDKVTSNNTSAASTSDDIGSSEEYYDDSLEDQPTVSPEKPPTTPDDGVTIEKAILAAEITPKASYSLIDYPIRYDDTLGDSYTQAKFGDKNEFFGFSSSDSSSSEEEVNTASGYSAKELENSVYESTKETSNAETMKKSPQTYNGYKFPSWNFLDIYNVPKAIEQKPFSAMYRNSDFIKSTQTDDIKSNGLGLSDDGSYDPMANGDFLHLGYPPSTYQPSTTFSPELTAQLEQERQYQIQSAKFYLKQIEAAQEYASKVQALQDANIQYQSPQASIPWWPISQVQETRTPSTTTMAPQTSKPKTVPKTYAPGTNNYGDQNRYISNAPHSPTVTSPAHINSLVGGGWMVPFVPTASPSGFVPYTGPTASPVVLPSGFLADTEEVTHAKIAHLQALMKAIESTAAWKTHQSQRWS